MSGPEFPPEFRPPAGPRRVPPSELLQFWFCMGNRVSLFVTCIVDQLFPKVGMDMADVLERLGYQVDFPESQTCCGQPAFNSG